MTPRSLLHPARYPDEPYSRYRLQRTQAQAAVKAHLKGRVIRPPLRPRPPK